MPCYSENIDLQQTRITTIINQSTSTR